MKKIITSGYSVKTKRNCYGFTLLEVLIALVIFSIISITCYKQISSSALSTDHLEKKYLALWIGETALEGFFIEHEWPELGEKVTQTSINNVIWSISVNVTETDSDDFRKIEARIYAEDKVSDNPVLSLTRFIGKN